MRIVTLLTLTLMGCGASSELIGPSTYEINCRRSRGNCWQEAQRVCPQGFQQLDGADHTAYIVSSGAVIPAYKGEMIVKCTGEPLPVAAAQEDEPERPRAKRTPPRR